MFFIYTFILNINIEFYKDELLFWYGGGGSGGLIMT